MYKIIVTTVLASCLLKEMVTAIDYCNTNLNCPRNTKHIGCGNTGNFARNCSAGRTLVPMTADLKAYLLKKHNQARSNIASGKIRGYKTANRMIEMTWNAELAKLAEFNAKTCKFGHDQCRNTATYKYAGQNIAIYGSQPNYLDTVEAIDRMFANWFNEYMDCDMTYINKYRDSSKKIGHFTQIVRDGANQLGCALTKFETAYKYIYFVCNYSMTNIMDRPIYTTGKQCSACSKGCSGAFAGLCNHTEVIPMP